MLHLWVWLDCESTDFPMEGKAAGCCSLSSCPVVMIDPVRDFFLMVGRTGSDRSSTSLITHCHCVVVCTCSLWWHQIFSQPCRYEGTANPAVMETPWPQPRRPLGQLFSKDQSMSDLIVLNLWPVYALIQQLQAEHRSDSEGSKDPQG